jgi:glucoamylase
VWDGADIPGRGLYRGRPSGSAMPLVWAHSEHIKLLRSLREERVFDMPPQPRRRYQLDGVRARHASWRPNQKIRQLSAGKILRIELTESAMVHWSRDNWRTSHDTPTVANAFGMHVADLDTADLAPGEAIVFTLYWSLEKRWQDEDYRLAVA